MINVPPLDKKNIDFQNKENLPVNLKIEAFLLNPTEVNGEFTMIGNLGNEIPTLENN